MYEQCLPFEAALTAEPTEFQKKSKKVDLHRHLLGSVSPSTFLAVAREHNLDLGNFSLNELESRLTVREPVPGLQPFFRPWHLLSKLLVSPDVVTAIVFSALADAAADNVGYVELRAAWGMTGKERFGCKEFLRAAQVAIRNAEESFGIRGRVVFGITRHVFARHTSEYRERLWTNILKAACQFKDDVVVGFDLSGIEEGAPAHLFKHEFRLARAEGFPITVHCGETTSSDDVWDALVALEPKRISHALSSVNDSSLLTYLQRNRIPIEVCPTTNWLTQTVPNLWLHPVKEFLSRGIKVCICTDNPAICGTNLSKEFAVLQSVVGISEETVTNLMAGGWGSCFGQVGQSTATIQ